MGYKRAVNLQKLKPKVSFLTPHGGCRPLSLKRLARVTALAALVFHLGAIPVLAQTVVAPSGASATITFADGSSVQVRTTRDKLPSVEILPGETVSVQIQLPQPFADGSMSVQGLDGGAVTQDGAVAADGTVFLQFQAGLQLGLYRVLLHSTDRSVLLQFECSNPDPQ